MGQIWLTGMYDWLRDAGLDVDVYDSAWTTRSRSSGGYEDVRAIGIHHDASAPGSSEKSACDWAWKNSTDRPIGCIRLSRNGHIVIGAAGATNTMGVGGPLTTTKGTIPQDKGNIYMLAIEAGNSGVGETWPRVQLDAYLVMVDTLCTELGLAHSDVFSHAGYCQPSCPGRKIDPAGPTPDYPNLGGTSGAKTWPDSAFRAYLDTLVPPAPPEPEPEPEDEMTDADIEKIANLCAQKVWTFMLGDIASGQLDQAGDILRSGVAKVCASTVWTYKLGNSVTGVMDEAGDIMRGGAADAHKAAAK